LGVTYVVRGREEKCAQGIGRIRRRKGTAWKN